MNVDKYVQFDKQFKDCSRRQISKSGLSILSVFTRVSGKSENIDSKPDADKRLIFMIYIMYEGLH